MRSHFRTQTGSVTAELAVALPAVLVVATTLISGMAVGAVKVQATHAAATLARAASRGEALNQIAKRLGVTPVVETDEEFVCVRAQVQTPLLLVSEKSCARKLGL